MYSKIVLWIALLVAIVLVGVEGNCLKKLTKWLKGGEKNGAVSLNVFTYEGEQLDPIKIDWQINNTKYEKIWDKLKAKYENDTYKIDEMILPVYVLSDTKIYWITYDPKKLAQVNEEMDKTSFNKMTTSFFETTDSKPKVLLYLKPKSEPENEFTVKVYEADAKVEIKAKAKLGEVKFTDIDVAAGGVTNSSILGKVSEKWPDVTKIYVTSFSNGFNYKKTIENPMKPGLKSYGVRGLRLEIELAGGAMK
ncbi:hypothetical protein Ddc_14162 [Ditylenchus destructor]|nr:hypothetical protein Ddc_14162 [Ditylenchus destructor]